jgi:phosphoglycerol transferase MdoB-like AlkP superfamily enzyme
MISIYIMPFVIIIATLLIIQVLRKDEFRKNLVFSGKMILSIILIVFLFSHAGKSEDFRHLALPSVALLFVILRIVFRRKIKGMI